MSYDPTILIFWEPPLGAPSRAADLPPDQPAMVRDAGRVWSHGLIVGEALAVETTAAQDALNTVYRLPDDLPRLFLEDTTEILRDVYCEIARRLDASLDDGRPSGPGGNRLLSSPHIVPDNEGRLEIRGTRFPLDILQIRLRALCSMLSFALANDRLVVERDDSEQA